MYICSHFPEVIVGVVKRIFCYKEGIFIETDLFPANLSDIEYSVRVLTVLE